MKAIVSITNDPKYSFFLPIITWCWNKLNVDVICFTSAKPNESTWFAMQQINKDRSNRNLSYGVICPEHKEATYAQCSRLYASTLDLPENEVLITSDVDMAFFDTPTYFPGNLLIRGADLVPKGQFPMCYASAEVKVWRDLMGIKGFTYQECLDNLLGDIDSETMRGDYWSKDQEELYNKTWRCANMINRAIPGTQFAENRVDRDDINWRSYCGPDLIDAHLWRPGYEENNFKNIMELLKIQYPEDNFQWLIDYRNEYIKLL